MKNKRDVLRSLQSEVSTLHSVGLTADAFHNFIKQYQMYVQVGTSVNLCIPCRYRAENSITIYK